MNECVCVCVRVCVVSISQLHVAIILHATRINGSRERHFPFIHCRMCVSLCLSLCLAAFLSIGLSVFVSL